MTVSLLLVVVSISDPSSPGCAKDTDCKGDRICVAGQCQAPQGQPGRAEPEPVSWKYRPLGAAAESMVGVYSDLGGLLFFGPSIDVEAGSHLAVYGELRALGFGLLRYGMAGDTDGVHNSTSATDIGVGAGVRYYFGHKANRQGLYAGGFGEYVNVNSVAHEKTPAFVFHTAELLFAASVGYRWVFPGGVTWGVGAALGFAHVVDRSSHLVGSSESLPSNYANTASDGPGGMLTLEIGYAI